MDRCLQGIEYFSSLLPFSFDHRVEREHGFWPHRATPRRHRDARRKYNQYTPLHFVNSTAVFSGLFNHNALQSLRPQSSPDSSTTKPSYPFNNSALLSLRPQCSPDSSTTVPSCPFDCSALLTLQPQSPPVPSTAVEKTMVHPPTTMFQPKRLPNLTILQHI